MFLHLCVILIIFLLTVAFFSFQNQLFFLQVLLKNHKTFSYNIFHDIKYAYFLYDEIPNNWHWTFTKNMLTCFCFWRIFWIFIASIYFFKSKIPGQSKWYKAFYLISCVDWILIFYSFVLALQFHRNLYFYILFHES